MYAVAFDLDTDKLIKNYSQSYTNAYLEIKRFLETYGFNHTQGSLYFGESVDAVTCVTAIQALTKKYAWFPQAVRNIRMLRIEDNNDLMPAIDLVK